MAGLEQTVMVVNKSGKVVSTGKHLVNVFKEAKSAYLERKAELKISRDDELRRKATKRALRDGRGSPPETSPNRRDESNQSSRDSSKSRNIRRGSSGREHRDHHSDDRRREDRHRSDQHTRRGSDGDSRRKHSSRSERPPVERGYTDSFYANEQLRSPRRTKTQDASGLRNDATRDLIENRSQHQRRELRRRHSDSDRQSLKSPTQRKSLPSASTEALDLDLAYGELPPPLPQRRGDEEDELRDKMTTLQRILLEANCLHHSAQATIKSLQDNPDAMAAVALTMAEISNLVRKMAPGALASMRAAFPAAVALLASPEFLIAGGVAIGVTVVMLGGYKIVKKIKAKKEGAEDTKNELQELELVSDIDRIETWRKGIADAEAASVTTSVDGEFVTPMAAMQLREEGLIRDPKTKEEKRRSKEKDKSKKNKSEVSPNDRKNEKKEKKERKDKSKDKEASTIKLLFRKDKEQQTPTTS